MVLDTNVSLNDFGFDLPMSNSAVIQAGGDETIAINLLKPCLGLQPRVVIATSTDHVISRLQAVATRARMQLQLHCSPSHG